jgi:hypothetical protein
MPEQRCVKWEPVPGIQSHCGAISFNLDSRDELTVRMHFSLERDLLLKFPGVIALQWEEESFCMILLPRPWPQIGAGDYPTWTFPLLQVEHSAWLAEYQAGFPVRPGTERRVHFALVSLDDLVHILALPEVSASWVDVSRTPNPSMERTAARHQKSR